MQATSRVSQIALAVLSSAFGSGAEARLNNNERTAVIQKLQDSDETVLDQLSFREDRYAFQRPSKSDDFVSILLRYLARKRISSDLFSG